MDRPERFRAKLDRAGELIALVHSELAAYHAAEPYVFRTERLDNPPRIVLHIESVREPRFAWAS